MATTTILLALLSILAFLAAPSTAYDSNVLLTGDVLYTDNALSTPSASFIMQDDCNLVLYGGSGFQSNTHGYGVNCTLTLNDIGQLVVRNAGGSDVWSSTPAKKGSYAAVLRPDNKVAVYGPRVWATPALPSSKSNTDALGDEKDAIPAVKNLLFSDQTLYNNSQLSTRDYSLVMRSDCNLALVKAGEGDVWSSKTQGKGNYCFARLGHTGVLTIKDDHYKTVWSTKAKSNGEFVLVLQIHGQAAIYGPIIWSTSS